MPSRFPRKIDGGENRISHDLFNLTQTITIPLDFGDIGVVCESVHERDNGTQVRRIHSRLQGPTIFREFSHPVHRLVY
jgi:hypothetical protein